MSQDRADDTMALLESYGVNHIDTARSYGDSELRLAPWLADNRHKVFLATKTGERSGPAARTELEESLTRLGVDHVDLIQLHNLVEPDEWETAFAPGGVVEALATARDEGLCRFIGVTGHGVRIPCDAPAQPARVRLRLGVAAVQLRAARTSGLPRRCRGARSNCAPSARSPCRRSRRSRAAAGRVVAKASSAGTSR